MSGVEAIRFEAQVCRSRAPEAGAAIAFAVLPADASERLPRRGRTTVDATLDGHAFRVTLEPDGRRSHWLRIPETALEASGVHVGDMTEFRIQSVDPEPEPAMPSDLAEALAGAPDAREVWDATTTIARVDWIHWITSARQAQTREKRIRDACAMLSSGKKRVCCFDPSGYYSKAFAAPDAAPVPRSKPAM